MTEGLATQVSPMVCEDAVTPEPDKGTLRVELLALLTTLAVPLPAPLLCGEKMMLNVPVPPAETVNGTDVFEVKPDPLMLIAETCTEAFPVLERVTVFVLLEPTVTLPKDTLGGFALTVPIAEVTPVPVRETTGLDPPALLEIVAAPEAAPAAVGLNRNDAVYVLPAVTVRGKVVEIRLKPEPVTAIPEMIRSAFPELVIAAVFVLVLPTVTLPNAREVGATLIAGAGVDTPVPSKDTEVGEPAALLEIVAEPVTEPAALGEKVMVAV